MALFLILLAEIIVTGLNIGLSNKVYKTLIKHFLLNILVDTIPKSANRLDNTTTVLMPDALGDEPKKANGLPIYIFYVQCSLPYVQQPFVQSVSFFLQAH